MSNNKSLRTIALTAWATGLGAALGFVWPILGLFWTTFDADIETFAAQWISSATEHIFDGALTGFLLFGSLAWIGGRKIENEPEEEAETVTDNQRQIQLFILIFVLAASISAASLYMWGILAEFYLYESSLPAYFGMLIFSSSGVIYFGRYVLHELFQARHALVDKDKVHLYFIHLGNREYDHDGLIRQTKIYHYTCDQLMMRVWFGGLRFAVLPLDWESPPQPVMAQPAY